MNGLLRGRAAPEGICITKRVGSLRDRFIGRSWGQSLERRSLSAAQTVELCEPVSGEHGSHLLCRHLVRVLADAGLQVFRRDFRLYFDIFIHGHKISEGRNPRVTGKCALFCSPAQVDLLRLKPHLGTG